jgi:Tol biopolymer transport system component
MGTALWSSALLIHGQPAIGAFPGTDGVIAYGVGGGQIRTINPDGSAAAHLTAGKTPSWAPDGRSLVFVREVPTGGSQVRTINADGGEERVMATVPRFRDPEPSFSPDGRKIIYSTERALVVLKRNSGDKARLLRGLEVREPVFSPAGGRVAFVGAPRIEGGIGGLGIWTVRTNGGGLRKLTTARSILNDTALDYSPDGRRIIFQRLRPDQKAAMVMRADGMRLREIPGPFAYSPVFSPSGREIAFGRIELPTSPSTSRCLEIWRSTPAGEDATPVTDGCSPGFHPPSLSWQPIPAASG